MRVLPDVQVVQPATWGYLEERKLKGGWCKCREDHCQVKLGAGQSRR